MIMDFFKKQSIRNKVVIQVTSQVVIVSVLIIITMLFIVNKHLSEQTQALLSSKAKNIHEKIEQRIRYLVENTVLLTKNELMVNALTDTIGRKKYLTPLVENFMEGKDVTSLDVVDYDGRPIFQTQTNTPLYNKSKNLRTALALNQVTVYIQKSDKRIVVISPIEYYSTTQGAAIVVFDMASIARENLPLTKTLYMKLVRGEEIIFSNNYDPKLEYRSVVHYADDKMRTFKDLGIALEIGLPQNIYRAPINEAIVKLVIIGLLFIIISIFTSTMTANNITQPILELYRRVKASADDKDILCSPLGSDDEVEKLAKAFDERTLQLQYQVEHDALTSLPNRVLFMDRLHQAIKVAKRKKDKIAVLFMDLDRFKEVNDSFGHDFGDELLKIVSTEVKAHLRASDSIARLGGDEFTILLDHIKNTDAIVNIAQKIMQTFKEPFTIKNHKFFITCSIGIAIYPLNGETPDKLLKNADAAMYKAKDDGRNTYQFYIDEMTDKAYGRITLETQLRQALKNEEFEVYYQPQVDMGSEDIIGMEALIRWHHPEMGFVPPDKFIPLAEETGIIVEIDRWVMNSALEQFMKWKEDGLNPGILSLNLSMVQLNHEGFIDEVKRVMSLTNMPPKLLMFEVTESQIMKNPQQTIAKLENLKEIGVSLAVDDFGTGHSSLSYLKRLPIDKIKIDQSFVRDIPEDSDDMELTRAIIAISKSLKRSVIAEGVETYEQAQFLQENECIEAQGYLYHRPQNAQAITKLLVRE
ncbi:putative bifunctional diguanylate cyclase/phosphodiesterase [Sulfurimonas sp. CS5]|uniref:putative bifunctional diguanylate cyclase/phosphodiesterase n=1 Tax=Sulfurimonas sp. CS5 TaxID=3391145 RepID=UPI0039EA8ED0